MSTAARDRLALTPNISQNNPGNLKDEHLLCSPIDFTAEPLICIIGALYVVFGSIFTLFGYRCFKWSMFLIGFTFSTSLIYLICIQDHLLPPYGNVCVALSAGVLFGLITMLIQYMGLFVMGFHTGVLVAITGLTLYDHSIDRRPQTYICVIMTLLGSGIFFAVLNLYWKKSLTIFGTCLYGGAVVATSVDYYVERSLMLKWVWQRTKLEMPVAAPCSLSWLALAAWPAITVVGLLVQCVATAKGIYHEQSISGQKRSAKPPPRPMLTREQRQELMQQKYRYLYQVRTAHGDVISQAYLKALQLRSQCGQWNCPETCEGGGGGSGGDGNGNGGGGGGGVIKCDSTIGYCRHMIAAGHGAGGAGGAGGGIGGECSTLHSDSTHLTVLPSDHHIHTDSDDDLMEHVRVMR